MIVVCVVCVFGSGACGVVRFVCMCVVCLCGVCVWCVSMCDMYA